MNKRAITIAYNDDRNSAWMFERCRPSVERYAALVKADLLVKRFNGPIHYLDKYAMIDQARRDGYRQALQLDADVFIHTDEDIFDTIGEVKIAAKTAPRMKADQLTWFAGYREPWTYNAGVILACPRLLSAFLLFANEHREQVIHGDESILVPYLKFSGTPVTPMPRRFNLWANWTNPSLDGEERGFFHFSGAEKRKRFRWFQRQYLNTETDDSTSPGEIQ